jgi:CheY-like chemotaxis protein
VRLEAGAVRIEPEHFQLLDLLEDVQRDLSQVYRANGVSLHIRGMEGAAACTGGVTLVGDAGRVRDALHVVLSNACHYSSGRGGHVWCDVSLSAVGIGAADGYRDAAVGGVSDRAAGLLPFGGRGCDAGALVHHAAVAVEAASMTDDSASNMPHSSAAVVTRGVDDSCGPRLLTCAVRDEGLGIADGSMATLFQAFGRLHTADEGTGLGLNIAKRAMQAHGGDVSVWSAGLGKGSTFTVSALVERVSMAAVAASVVHTAGAVGASSPVCAGAGLFSGAAAAVAHGGVGDEQTTSTLLVSCTVLIVDDDAVTRRMMARVLRPLPHVAAVHMAANGREAVCAVLGGVGGVAAVASFTHVLLDGSMPVMGGVEAARLLREGGYAGRVYGVTGGGLAGGRGAFLGAGVDGVLVKPVARAELVALVCVGGVDVEG